MEQFRRYMDRELNLENVRDQDRLRAFGVSCTYFSDPPEDFDELEFRTGFEGAGEAVITVAIELGKIKRIMFGLADEKDPEAVRSMTESQLENFLAEKGGRLAGFFEYITR